MKVSGDPFLLRAQQKKDSEELETASKHHRGAARVKPPKGSFRDPSLLVQLKRRDATGQAD